MWLIIELMQPQLKDRVSRISAKELKAVIKHGCAEETRGDMVGGDAVDVRCITKVILARGKTKKGFLT